MKVLLDEQLPHRLRKHLGAHHVYTVDYMGWAALKNGELLRAAEAEGFEVFLTGEKNLTYQQNMTTRRMAILTPFGYRLRYSQTQSLADRRRYRQRRARIVPRGRVRHVPASRPLTPKRTLKPGF